MSHGPFSNYDSAAWLVYMAILAAFISVTVNAAMLLQYSRMFQHDQFQMDYGLI